MNIIFVVSHRSDWSLDIEGVDVVPAQSYLADPEYRNLTNSRVFNLCSSYHYQGAGYYVSLLAQARGHDPLPDVKAIEALRLPAPHRMMPDSVLEVARASLACFPSEVDDVAVHSYFGRAVDTRLGRLCEQLFNWLKMPMLCAHFKREAGQWHLASIATLPASALPPKHVPQVIDAAAECLHAHHDRTREPSARKPSVAILCGENDAELPSNAAALQKFIDAAAALDMHAEIVRAANAGRIMDFDALFLRDTTAIDHYTYRIARAAAHAGMVVIDDADSILKCNNKVYLAELLARHAIPTPKSLHVDLRHLDDVVPALGLPCILKQPDGAFSHGVVKVESLAQLHTAAATLLGASERILAQEYLPTAFDWRIGILDRKPLFVCKYYMAHGHWQIIKHERDQRWYEGATEAVALDDVPDQVLEVALRAANLIGDGFYGVDLKQVGERCAIIEINDNPNVDAGNEDGILKDDLYRQVMLVFRNRVELRKRHAARRA
ncbi:MAG: RimK family protein [Herminiimonas sp.]|nr:RimK family protein [Herminiimonas sp.]